ncbi:TetR/AcrR family transcriptional regulator [Aquisalimonas asiatica]|uniref:Transcriptional regulator, TetR family n=1 Tax=Aquisalimonas asiatica TaxID=406100 RepID=A0A1H8VAH0_9GAMM|nr:TetR/AcrR family transcriptional regulator [Aquisalimonas asiatica]SEP12419.1 transcriptional regulator, TetR family [Aquisalimonas asiatica]
MVARKRDTLLDTAERLFYAEGFHATGVDRVVAEAGVARMTLYNHFASKEALIEAVLDRRYARYLDELRRAVDTAAAGDAVMALAHVHCQWLETTANRGCIVIKAIGEFEQHHPAIADQGRRLKRELIAVIADALSRDGVVDDSVTAERVLVILEGADALTPVLGASAVTSHLRAMLPAVLASATRGHA